ncbi:MAG: MAPEG family protein, partial [Gammaproteobacteria bacterium]
MDILQPMFGMIALTAVVTLLLYGSRMLLIYRVTTSGGNLARAKHADETRQHLPGAFRNITDNYNHLFEQPTLFYAVV